MGTFTIQANQPKYQLRFQDVRAAEAPPADPSQSAAAQSATATSDGKQGDQIRLSGRKAEESAPKTLNLFDGEQKAASQQYMERLVTRQSEINLGPGAVQLQVATESAAPELLTSSKEPDAVQALKTKIQNLSNKAASSGEQVIRTGAVIQPHEAVQVQIGMASSVDTDKLLAPKSAPGQDAIKPGVYAGVAVKSETVSGKLAVDTAFGKPRVEVGTAVAAGDACTVGVSFLQSADEKQRTLRLGTEVHAGPDTVVGVNLNQPLTQTTQVNGNTAVGLYLNTKF